LEKMVARYIDSKLKGAPGEKQQWLK
jgi:hypothetical protein